jgi:hypothetical protein
MSSSTLPTPPAARRNRHQPAANLYPSSYFFTLVHRHHQAAFQIAHGILRDEVAAEKITRQVFARVRRRIERGADHASAVLWIYHASLRFACRYYWKSITPAMRRRLGGTCRNHQGEFDLPDFVRVLALKPDKIDQHDCELIALRHVLGLPLVQIGQLLRMHPYEISNRVTWSLERLKETQSSACPLPAPDAFAHAVSA